MKLKLMNVRPQIMLLLFIIFVTALAAPAYPENKFRLKPGAQAGICVDCHETMQKILESPFVHTPVKIGECAGCHNPHTSDHGQLLNSDINKLCSDCHKDVIPENARSIHTVVLEGNCTSCHDSHASENKYILKKKGNELCFECHGHLGDSIEKALYKHEPVEKGKGCINCHNPHASASSDYILKKDAPSLCIECHKTNQKKFVQKHMNYPVEKSRCTSCHNAHGSSKKKIVYDDAHIPVAEKKCDTCHEGPSSSTPLNTKKDGVELCRDCHEDYIDKMYDKNHLHWPIADKKGCLNCHDPHAAREENLVAGSIRNLCGKCHEDTVTLQNISINNPENNTICKPVRDGNCIGCHSPHSADNVLLIAEESVSFGTCDKCHEWQTHSTHPIGPEVIDPRNKNLKVDCQSCHKTCGTGNKATMMHYETTYILCTQCHSGFKR